MTIYTVFNPETLDFLYTTSAKESLKAARRTAKATHLDEHESITIRIIDANTGHWYAHYRIYRDNTNIIKVTYRWRDDSDNPTHHERYYGSYEQ